MKLYRVAVEYSFLLVAEDDDDAYDVAREEKMEAMRDCDDVDVMIVSEITDEKNIPREWRGPALPYGGDDEHSCEWYLRKEPEPFIDTKTTDMFTER